MPILTRIRYYRPVWVRLRPGTARWLPLASAFTALSRRIRYYQDNTSSGPDPSISIPREAAVSLSRSRSLSLSATSVCHPLYYRHVRSIDQPPQCAAYMHIYVYIHIQYERVYMYTQMYAKHMTASKRGIDACSDDGDRTSRIFGSFVATAAALRCSKAMRPRQC